ncbi:Type I antifreeze protein [Candidatus Sulfotelmatobacter kueseliae]|uniref:Type I antifreeze protein n=1 Tax=Candidatus Sulfotelmatobacter kueseliae TaxID=2042962 RepID=A0A2U3KFG9_9BACT|nr:Type I antifreeze protein [Candidatus Sulfotelmatobacter kueseliae]
MPLYEYQCKKCGHRFEKIQKFSDKMVKKCPDCGGQVEQMISAPAVQFKGSGWYVTDYAKKTSSPGSAGSGDPSSRDSSSKDKKDDKSKPDSGSKESSSKESSSKESTSKESSSKETPRKGSGRHK